jgi:hypothetical protein
MAMSFLPAVSMEAVRKKGKMLLLHIASVASAHFSNARLS